MRANSRKWLPGDRCCGPHTRLPHLKPLLSVRGVFSRNPGVVGERVLSSEGVAPCPHAPMGLAFIVCRLGGGVSM
jgi:hypothetical protein